MLFIIPNVVLKKIRSKGKLNFEYFYKLKYDQIMTLVFASNNEHKIREIKSILGNSFTLLSLQDINILKIFLKMNLLLKEMPFQKPDMFIMQQD